MSIPILPPSGPFKEPDAGSADIRHAAYLMEPMVRPRETLDTAVRKLLLMEFDAIVCCGISGLLVAPMVALAMNKRFGVVRKREDKDNHSTFRVETTMHIGDSWIFMDDLIATGGTLKFVRAAMMAIGFDKEVGTYTYGDRYFFNSVARYNGGD